MIIKMCPWFIQPAFHVISCKSHLVESHTYYAWYGINVYIYIYTHIISPSLSLYIYRYPKSLHHLSHHRIIHIIHIIPISIPFCLDFRDGQPDLNELQRRIYQALPTRSRLPSRERQPINKKGQEKVTCSRTSGWWVALPDSFWLNFPF